MYFALQLISNYTFNKKYLKVNVKCLNIMRLYHPNNGNLLVECMFRIYIQ